MHNLSFAILIVAAMPAAFAADFTAELQWVRTTGGSGATSVAAVAGDGRGNLFVVGSTTSLDFPVVSAAQVRPGGSTLVRIHLVTSAAQRLFPANLPAINAAATAASEPATLYAASGPQVWASADAGSTWVPVSPLPSGLAVSSLAVNPVAPATVYAGTSTRGVYTSTDGGFTWTPANSGIMAAPNGNISVSGIWVDPSAPDVLFASTAFGLARSIDRGGTWTMTGSTVAALAFDPFTAGTLFAIDGNVISKSADNGRTFEPLSPLPNQAIAFALAPDPRRAGVLYVGSSAGIYESANRGGAWTLKAPGRATVLAADPNSQALYANVAGYGIVKSVDGFATASPVGPNQPSITRLMISGSYLFEISAPTPDAFVMKFDAEGGVVYSTYLGGSGSDEPSALAVGPDGSVYVTGLTDSADFPVTDGVYLPKPPSTQGGSSSFVFKLSPEGALDWATYFPGIAAAAIAVDAAGNPYIGGATGGGLPTTPGAYQTSFQQSITSNGFFSVIGPTAAFVTKFNAKATALIYSTYVSADNAGNIVEKAQALAVDAGGNAWIGGTANTGIIPSHGPGPSVVKLNANGSAVLASAVQGGLTNVSAIALDGDSNVYVAGAYSPQSSGFPATPGAFQSAPQPRVPAIPYEGPPGGGLDAFVAKWDSGLTHLLAATLLGGELPDAATSIAIGAGGAVFVGGYTDSKAFPTHAPLQTSFSSRSGFVAAFDSNLSNLLFSTYLGDERRFAVAGVVPDGNGNVLLAGSTLGLAQSLLGRVDAPSPESATLVVANKLALRPSPAVRLDTVQNYASRIAAAVAPGEPIVVLGEGFTSGAQIIIDGSPLVSLSAGASSLVAVLPYAAVTSGAHTLQVSSNGSLSNPVYAPAAPTSPAIYSVDGSGSGQGYILNSDGTLNSPSNPAAPGSAITIFAAGAGRFTTSDGYAITAQTPAVFIDGFYSNGIAAKIGPVAGLPGDVYQLSVFVPDVATLAQNNPDLKNFKFPPQSKIRLVMAAPDRFGGSQSSQNGIYISIQ